MSKLIKMKRSIQKLLLMLICLTFMSCGSKVEVESVKEEPIRRTLEVEEVVFQESQLESANVSSDILKKERISNAWFDRQSLFLQSKILKGDLRWYLPDGQNSIVLGVFDEFNNFLTWPNSRTVKEFGVFGRDEYIIHGKKLTDYEGMKIDENGRISGSMTF